MALLQVIGKERLVDGSLVGDICACFVWTTSSSLDWSCTLELSSSALTLFYAKNAGMLCLHLPDCLLRSEPAFNDGQLPLRCLEGRARRSLATSAAFPVFFVWPCKYKFASVQRVSRSSMRGCCFARHITPCSFPSPVAKHLLLWCIFLSITAACRTSSSLLLFMFTDPDAVYARSSRFFAEQLQNNRRARRGFLLQMIRPSARGL